MTRSSVQSYRTINGTTHDLWRTVDQHGHIRDRLVQRHRNPAAVKTFFRTPGTHWVQALVGRSHDGEPMFGPRAASRRLVPMAQAAS
jgi:hypothetical protein